MKACVSLASRLLLGMGGLVGIASSNMVEAQAVASVIAPSSLSAPPPTVAYQDRYIDGGSLKPDISAGLMDSASGEGLARSLQVDGVVSALTSTEPGSHPTVLEHGIIVRSQWDTVAYGAWSLDAAARSGGSGLGPAAQGQGGVITLRQRAMPFDGGWQADNSLGDINSPEINLARTQTRFYLPTTPMQGLSSEWRGPNDIQIMGGGGEPGLYDGIQVPDFRPLGGTIATAGAEWSPNEHWLVGSQLTGVHDVNLYGVTDLNGAPTISSQTGLLSAAWQSSQAGVQFDLLDGEVSGHRNAVGSWLDATLSTNRMMQSAGLFRIDPELTWGNQLIADDVQGGYYRVGYQSRQWLWDGGLDEVLTVSEPATKTTFLTGDTRYQILRDWGVGVVANAVHNNAGDSWSSEGYVDHINRWGIDRAQVDVARNPIGQDVTMTLQRAWSTHTGLHVSTSIAVDRSSQSLVGVLQQDSTVIRAAMYGGGRLTTRLGLESNVQWATALAGSSAPGIAVNISLSWQLRPAWSVLLSYYDSRTGSWSPLVVQSPLTPPVATWVPSVEQRGVFLTLRYQRSSGSHFAPLGGGPGAGGGAISGVVYLDANANRRFDADEAGVANLTVILDGRFSVQTDDAGRFEFPVVASGHHVLTVSSDNLPLPWVLAEGGRTEVQVTTRGHIEVGIAAIRPH
jgi:hypothetical protein